MICKDMKVRTEKKNFSYPELCRTYKISDPTLLKNQTDVEILKTGMFQLLIKSLHLEDLKVFNYCVVTALDNKRLFTTREIVVKLHDLVLQVFPESDIEEGLNFVKDSLYRLQKLNTVIIDDRLRGFTTRIIDNVDIYLNDNREEQARIVINLDVLNEIIKRYMITQNQNISSSTSKLAALYLQCERFRLATISPEEKDLVSVNDYNYFRKILLLPGKRINKHIKTIENVLNDLTLNNSVIQSFERKGFIFKLDFFNMSEEEWQKVFISGQEILSVEQKDDRDTLQRDKFETEINFTLKNLILR